MQYFQYRKIKCKNMEQICVIEKSGGNGAVREFIEKILNDHNSLPNKK